MSAISEFQEAEAIFPSSAPSGTILTVNVNSALQERRIYLYIEVKQGTSGAFVLGGEVTLHSGNALVARYPATIGDFSGLTPGQSISSLLNGGGSPVGDSVVVRLAQPFSIASVTLQPLRINGIVDQIRYNVTGIFPQSGAAVLTSLRAYLACLSTKY